MMWPPKCSTARVQMRQFFVIFFAFSFFFFSSSARFCSGVRWFRFWVGELGPQGGLKRAQRGRSFSMVCSTRLVPLPVESRTGCASRAEARSRRQPARKL
eukprot:14214696-Alexandrium_andersonii.AAC.1